MRSRSRKLQRGGLSLGVPNIGETVKAAVKAEIAASPIGQQALAAKQGITQLTTALPDAVQGVKNAVGEQLDAQKDAVKAIVDDRIAAAGLPTAGNTSAYANNGSGENEDPSAYANNGSGENEDYSEYEGGGRRSRSRPTRRAKKISPKGINKMASRRGTRRSTRRRAGSRKARKASRKANRK
jgi:hypothetical protein